MAILYRAGAISLPFQTALQELKVPFAVRGGADLWQSVAAKLVVGSLTYLRDGASTRAVSRLGTNKRGQIVRQQLDQVRAAVRDQFSAACRHVQRIVGDAVPSRSSDREQAEWESVVEAVIAVAASCSSQGADDRLPLPTPDEKRRLASPDENATASTPWKRNLTTRAAAGGNENKRRKTRRGKPDGSAD
jgi:superfamily I DNA/RNA helicase